MVVAATGMMAIAAGLMAPRAMTRPIFDFATWNSQRILGVQRLAFNADGSPSAGSAEFDADTGLMAQVACAGLVTPSPLGKQ